MLKFVLRAANNQFSDKFSNGGGLLSSALLFLFDNKCHLTVYNPWNTGGD